MNFIDSVEIYIKAGDGGKGHVSFRKEKFVPKGGPDGGTGGKGGDINFIANSQMSTLIDFKYKTKFIAKDGVPGGKSRCTGKDGKDLVINVPLGTEIYDAETNELIVDVNEANKVYRILKGGKGGMGNAEFATPTHQAPRYAQPGLPGPELNIKLELKLLADVGLVGFPNVGKSTFISVISAAKPKIADYHFTTLIPNLGVVRIADNESYVVADIPGLIEGASEGKGLGHQFLKHVERCSLLMFIFDAQSPDIRADYKVLIKEIKKYNKEMLNKPMLFTVNKIDTVDTEKISKLKKMKIDKKNLILMSAATLTETDSTKYKLWEMIKEYKGL